MNILQVKKYYLLTKVNQLKLQTKFTCPPFGKAFLKKAKEIKNQGKKQIKSIEKHGKKQFQALNGIEINGEEPRNKKL